MNVIGIELNDAAITIAGESKVIHAEPGYAIEHDGRLRFGADARKFSRLFPRRIQNRFWKNLDQAALSQEVGPCTTSADLAHEQLRQLRKFYESADQVVFAVPASWSVDQLGLLLGIAAEQDIAVSGLVDSAIASTSREYPGRDLVHVDLSLHDVTLTRVVQSGGAALGEREVIDTVGFDRLERGCVELIASTFLEATRFDPLHDAKTEQYLDDHLHEWLGDAGRNGEVSMQVPFGGNEFMATLRLDELAVRLGEICEPVTQKLRAMLPAGQQIALQCSSLCGVFPGLLATLERVPGASVFVLESGAAGLGAARRLRKSNAGEGFRLVTSLPWDQPPAETGGPVDTISSGAEPSHALFEARAYRLGDRPLRIGTELGSNEYGIRVGGGIAGISRRHCTIERLDGRVVLTDHSRFGTVLNGHAIDGSVVLQPGDVLSIGSPAQDIRIITEEDDRGAQKI